MTSLEVLILRDGALENMDATTAFLRRWARWRNTFPWVTTLDLSNSDLTDEGASYLGDLLNDRLRGLETLTLEGNTEMGEEGLRVLADKLATANLACGSRRIQKLTLESEVVRGSGLDALCCALWSGRLDHLKEVHFKSRQVIENDDGECRWMIETAYRDGERGMANLLSRFCRTRPVGDESMAALLGGMGRSKELQHLHAGWLGIGDSSGALIVNNFRRGFWDNLETCDIAGSSPGGYWVLELAGAFRARSTLALRTLKLNCSYLGALRALADALAAGACPKLENLCVVAVRGEISTEDLVEGEACLDNAVRGRPVPVEVRVYKNTRHPRDFHDFLTSYGPWVLPRVVWERWANKEWPVPPPALPGSCCMPDSPRGS